MMSLNRTPAIAISVFLSVFGMSLAVLAQDRSDAPAPVEVVELAEEGPVLPPGPASGKPADVVARDKVGTDGYDAPTQATGGVIGVRSGSSSLSTGAIDPDPAARQGEQDDTRWTGDRPPAYRRGGRGTHCQVPQNAQCRSCAVDCPSDKIAHCTGGSRGIFNKPDSTICPTEAKCECK